MPVSIDRLQKMLGRLQRELASGTMATNVRIMPTTVTTAPTIMRRSPGCRVRSFSVTATAYGAPALSTRRSPEAEFARHRYPRTTAHPGRLHMSAPLGAAPPALRAGTYDSARLAPDE